MNVGDIFWMFRGEDSQLQLDAKKAGEAAAGTAAKSFGGRFGPAIKQAAGTAIGAGIGAGIGIAFSSTTVFAGFEKRMNEVFTLLPNLTQSAMDKMSADVKSFARETGHTTEEVIPALYQAISAGVPPDNVFAFLRTANKGATAGVAQTVDEVSLLSAVTKGFGDTSQAAVTEAADLAQLMVKLGQTTIPELAASYGKAVPLAAALKVQNKELAAASASLFGVTGNTAEVMTQEKAVFTALITQNPLMTAGLRRMGFETSAAAIEALGLKGTLDGLVKTTGGNTQALQGMLGSAEAVTATLALTGAQSATFASNLTAMGNSAGTVDVAFKRMDSGAEATARKFAATMETMAIDLGGFINKFGPLPLIVSQIFGPQMLTKLTAGLGGLIGALSSVVGPKMAALGITMGAAAATAEVATETTGVVAGQATVATAAAPAAAAGGTIIGTAMGVAIAAAAGIAIALAFKSIFLDPALQQQTRDIGTAVGKQIQDGTTEQLAQSKAAIEKGIADINALPLGGFLYGDQINDLQGQLDSVNAEIARRAAEAGASVPEGLAAGATAKQGVWDGKVEDIVATFGTSIHGVWAAAHQAGSDGMLAMAQGITAARQKPLDAFDTLKEMLKHAMTPLSEVARLRGELTSKALAKGLKSGDPAVRAQALAARDAIYERLGELAAQGGKAGSTAMAELNKGIRSKVPAVHAAALAAKNAAIAELNKAKAGAAAAGAGAGQSFGDSLKASIAAALASVQADIKANPGKYTDTMNGLSGGSHAAGGIAPAYLPSLVGEKGPEIFVPEVAGRVLTTEQSMAALRGGGANVTIQVTGLVRARDPMEIATQARRFARLGLFTPSPVLG